MFLKTNRILGFDAALLVGSGLSSPALLLHLRHLPLNRSFTLVSRLSLLFLCYLTDPATGREYKFDVIRPHTPP